MGFGYENFVEKMPQKVPVCLEVDRKPWWSRASKGLLLLSSVGCAVWEDSNNNNKEQNDMSIEGGETNTQKTSRSPAKRNHMTARCLWPCRTKRVRVDDGVGDHRKRNAMKNIPINTPCGLPVSVTV